MDTISYTSTDLTEEQRLKLLALLETENPKPRNRAERRKQEKQNRKRRNKQWI